MIKIKNLKEYLNTFNENEEFKIVVVDEEKRIVHKHKMADFIIDIPALVIEVSGTEPLDELKEKLGGGTDE